MQTSDFNYKIVSTFLFKINFMILTIIAGLKRGELGIRFNDISLGIFCSSLPMGAPLFPAISPFNKEEIIELL